MNYIVIPVDVKDRLMTLRDQFIADIEKACSDLNPIQIQSGEYVLPLSVLDDPAFAGMRQKIHEDGNDSLITVRDVDPSEFIVFNDI